MNRSNSPTVNANNNENDWLCIQPQEASNYHVLEQLTEPSLALCFIQWSCRQFDPNLLYLNTVLLHIGRYTIQQRANHHLMKINWVWIIKRCSFIIHKPILNYFAHAFGTKASLILALPTMHCTTNRIWMFIGRCFVLITDRSKTSQSIVRSIENHQNAVYERKRGKPLELDYRVDAEWLTYRYWLLSTLEL